MQQGESGMNVLVAGGAGYIGSHMRATGVRRLVFSSSCATYGDPQRLPLDDSHPQAPVRINGEDFDTADGSCVRDYVHVSDLCDAHLLALGRLDAVDAPAFDAFNLGSEKGFSVKETVAVCREVTGSDIRYAVGPRRPGDPSAPVADARKTRELLGWAPKYAHLLEIVRTAWNWMLAQARA